VLVASILASPLACGAQTDYSIRIRSLDVTFAGLLDDFLTDVYLNPARLSELDSSMVYAATLPHRRSVSPYPSLPYYDWNYEWIEDVYEDDSYGTDPLAVGFFGTLGGKTALSLAAQVGLSASDAWDDDVNAFPYTDRARVRHYFNGRTRESQRYVFDAAIAPLTSGNAWGARVTGTMDTWRNAEVRGTETSEWLYTDPANTWVQKNSRHRWYESGRWEIDASAGYSMPKGLVGEVVLGVVFVEESQDVRSGNFEVTDNDADGNGIGYIGHAVENVYMKDAQETERDYSGLGGFLRLHLRWTENLRSAHFAGWSRSTGDGGTRLWMSDWESSFWKDESLSYKYADGTMDRGAFQSSLGYHHTAFDELLFALGVDLRYSISKFDESASGSFTVESSTGWGYEAPYRQSHDDTDDALSLALPVGLEWSCHKYLKIRIGAAFYAYRNTADRRLSNNAYGVLTSPFAGESGTLEFDDYEQSANVDARFNTGLEFNFNDRFVLDLATNSTYDVSLASYTMLSALYRF
jgi:hypothetical protein